ncbi:MAG: indolepyruvate oxidoreductase subunit beta, partial [Syntrophales bacterium]|nr:indolepyruvate oxidoreductase subunit beta [Syntrophales bacterium]
LSTVLMAWGMDVKKSEVHGMAQRGGCVTSHVRFGKKVYSPLERKGNVDILLAFEKLEAIRYLDFLKPNSRLILNDLSIYPPAVNMGEMDYPANIIDFLKGKFEEVVVVPAQSLASQAGHTRSENVVLLGVLSRWLEPEEKVWEEILQSFFPDNLVEANITAFRLGRSLFDKF